MGFLFDGAGSAYRSSLSSSREVMNAYIYNICYGSRRIEAQRTFTRCMSVATHLQALWGLYREEHTGTITVLSMPGSAGREEAWEEAAAVFCWDKARKRAKAGEKLAWGAMPPDMSSSLSWHKAKAQPQK